MRWLSSYLQQVFCKHDFEKSEGLARQQENSSMSGDNSFKEGTKVSLLCKKCGYHRSFWKLY
jgi:hypothetical protein